MIYRKEENVIIRSMLKEDIKNFVDAFAEQSWNKPEVLFESYYNRQENHILKVLVAEVLDKVAGYVTLQPNSSLGPFTDEHIPEVVDLNVLKKYQKQGIGNLLMDTVETIAKEVSSVVSLAVGLHYGYGVAQRMYVKRGYIPEGSGIWYEGKQLEPYKECINDDNLLLYFFKNLN